MAMVIAPYNASMRIGQGFNTYTQEICLHGAVTVDEHNSGGDHYIKGDNQPMSQIVSYCARRVTKLSQVTDAMNISASSSILSGTIGDSSTGSFVDPDIFKEATVNYFVQCQVTNQVIMAEDVTQLTLLGESPQPLSGQLFTRIYGDSFISGFIEGGEFDALISIRLNDEDDEEAKNLVMGHLEAIFGQGRREEAVTQIPAVAAQSGASDTPPYETTITVNYNGGGHIKDPAHLWNLETIAAAVAAFPQKVEETPQRIYAILSKYNILHSYQLHQPESPLDYTTASIYTNDLLDAYMDYKNLWKKLHQMTSAYESGQGVLKASEFNDPNEVRLVTQPSSTNQFDDLARALEKASTNPGADFQTEAKELLRLIQNKPSVHHSDYTYAATISGLMKARTDCRAEMNKIVHEVNAVMEDPSLATDVDRATPYVPPALLRKLIPTLEDTDNLIGDGASDPTGSRFFYKKSQKPTPPYLGRLLKDVNDRYAKSFKMSEYVGAPSANDENRLFFNLTRLHESMRIGQVVGYIQQSRVVGLELQYQGSNPKQTYGETTGTATTLPVSAGASVIAVTLQAALSQSLGVSVVFAVNMLTSLGESLEIQAEDTDDIDKTKLDVYHTRAPDGQWSLKGFWGQTLDKNKAPAGGFDRLGVFWGRDATAPKGKDGSPEKARPALPNQPEGGPVTVPGPSEPTYPVNPAPGDGDGGDVPGGDGVVVTPPAAGEGS